MTLNICNALGVLGEIDERVEKDKWDNDVSLITLASGAKYRMVHHSPKDKWWRQRATIYAGRGVFIRFEYTTSSNDCVAETCEAGGYKMWWGDGEPGDVIKSDKPGAPDLKETLGKIHASGSHFEEMLLVVLTAVDGKPDLWDKKDVQQKEAA
jgi:hypothetical protein